MDKNKKDANLEELTKKLGEKLEIDKKRIRLKELEFEVTDPDLWKNSKNLAEEKNKEAGMLRDMIQRFDSIDSVDKIRGLEAHLAMQGKYDKLSAIISTLNLIE